MATVRRTHDAHVVTLVLEDPPRGNALDRPMLAELEAHLAAIAADVARDDARAPRAVVLRGAGERSFSTGYNIGELARELADGPSVQDEASHPLERALRALDACPVPTIALVHGHAYGAGCELAVTCDLRVAAADARFCMPPAKLGVLYSASGTGRFVELVGLSATKELFFTGEPIDAARALALGLISRVVPKPLADGEATALARTIAANAPLSVRHAKTVLHRWLRGAAVSPAATAEIARLREECFRSADFRAAARAFLEKRGPVDFEGR